MNPEKEGIVNGAWMPTIVADAELEVGREALVETLNRAHIDARVFFWPLSSLPIFGGVSQCPIAEDVASRGLNLPSYHDLSGTDQARVIEVVSGLLT